MRWFTHTETHTHTNTHLHTHLDPQTAETTIPQMNTNDTNTTKINKGFAHPQKAGPNQLWDSHSLGHFHVLSSSESPNAADPGLTDGSRIGKTLAELAPVTQAGPTSESNSDKSRK